MATPPRELARDGIYHVTNRGNNRMPVFRDKQDKERFIYRLFKLQKKYGFRIITFTIMDNHFHLLIKDNGFMLPMYIAALEDYYAKYFNKKYNHIGHVFQGRFKSYLIRGYLDLLKNFRYIVRNCVVARIINSIFKYEWTVINKDSQFYEFVDLSFIDEALLNTGNTNLEKYLNDSVDDLWAHEIENLIRSDSESLDIYQDYIIRTGFDISDGFEYLKMDYKKKTIDYLMNMGLNKKQVSQLTSLSYYKISRIASLEQ